MNSVTLTLPGTIRSKKNSKQVMIGGRRVPRRPMIIPSDAYAKWEKAARQHLMVRHPGIIADGPILSPVHVEAHFFFVGPQPDLQGCMESVADCLQGIVWKNDNQIFSWDGSRLHHTIVNPHTIVIVRWQ